MTVRELKRRLERIPDDAELVTADYLKIQSLGYVHGKNTLGFEFNHVVLSDMTADGAVEKV